MKTTSSKKSLLVLTFFCCLNFLLFSQNENNKWVVGVGINAIDYYPTNEDNMGGFFNEITNAKDHWNIYGPKIHAARFIREKLNLGASFSLNKISKLGDIPVNDLMYYALEAHVQYAFLRNESKFVPYVFVGGGYNWVEGFNSAGTVDSGIGANYWFSEKVGVNAQGAYKYNSPDYAILSHFNYSLSVIFRLNSNRRSSWAGNGNRCF